MDVSCPPKPKTSADDEFIDKKETEAGSEQRRTYSSRLREITPACCHPRSLLKAQHGFGFRRGPSISSQAPVDYRWQ